MNEFDRMDIVDQNRAISKLQMEWLKHISMLIPISEVLDLGFGCGFSAMVLDRCGFNVTAINNEKGDEPRLIEAIKRYKRVCHRKPHIIYSSTDLALPRLVSETKLYGLIFVDAGHRFDDVFIDVYYSTKLCVEGGILALDDTYYGAIRSVGNWINSNLSHIWEPFHFLENTISWKRSSKSVDDWPTGLIHRTHSGPPKWFEVATENADEFMFYPGELESKKLGFQIWRKN